MAHRASFDKRIPIGLAIAGTLGVALYLGYKKYEAGAQETPKDEDSAKKEAAAVPKKESAPSSSGTTASGASAASGAAAAAKPAVAPTEPPKSKAEPPKAEPPKTPPKPQAPKRQSGLPKPTVQEPPKPPVIQEPKPSAPEPKPIAHEQKPIIQEPKPAAPEPKPAPPASTPAIPAPAPAAPAAPSVPEEKKSIPPPIDTADSQPLPGKNADVPVKVEPLSPKHKAEMASAGGIQLDTTADELAKSLGDSDPLISLQSWGELEDQFSTVNRRHSPSELHIPSSIVTDAKADSNSNKVGDQDIPKSAFPESDSQALQQGNS